MVETTTDTLPVTDAVVGIDLDLPHLAILSDSTKIDAPRFPSRAQKKLKKAQRRLSRKAKGSSDRTKALINVARAPRRWPTRGASSTTSSPPS